MNKILLALFTILVSSTMANAQCTTTNATSCQCKDPNQTDCDLLPDIQLGHPPFFDYTTTFGILEFSQTGNGVDNGRLKVTVSTPNTGHGPLEIHTTNVFVCGTDTFIGTPPTICPDGVTYPRIEIDQRIYHKNAGTMTYYDRFAGTMTYHPSHGHMHVDNWGNYTLRVRDTLEPNPLNWPLIGAGTKLAFCVEDYGTCSGYPDHCLDSSGASLNQNSDFPNYGLGGGSYNCSSVVQGISSGYVDIYWTSLDGMWIDLPPGICNGTYYIVCEVDPNHNFLEEDETNNVYAVPFTLTKQVDSLSSVPLLITVDNSNLQICQGSSITLSASNPMPNVQYLWSNGDTTKFINVTTPGNYSVQITSQCGVASSSPVTVTVTNPPPVPAVTNDTIPVPGTANLSATSSYPVSWYDQPIGGTELAIGSTFTTPMITSSTTYYAEAREPHPGAAYNVGLTDSILGGVGGYYNGDQGLIFDCFNTFIIHQLTCYSPSAQTITVELRSSSNVVLHSVSVSVVTGMNVINVDIPVSPGFNYKLTRATGANLYRNNPTTTSVGFPFVVPNFCTIKTSTAGDEFWYFFYDWKIKLPDHDCTSPRIPVQAVVLAPNAIADVQLMNSLTVYPNPATGTVNISFKALDRNATIELIDAIGKVAIKKDVAAINGTVTETMNIASLTRGIYSVHILSSGKNYYQKLLIY